MSDTLKQQTKKGLYWSFFNQFSNYGMQFCIGIVMARLLSPSDYGITALPGVFMAIAGIFQDSGMAGALVRKEKVEEKDYSTLFIYSIAMGIFMYAILFTASPWIAKFFNTPILTSLIRVTALGFLWGPVSTVQYVILSRKLDFKTPTKISITTKLFSGIVGILLAYIGYGLWALVISGVLSSFLGLIIVAYIVKWYPKTGWSKDSFKYLWNYGNKMLVSSLLDTAYNNITPVFVGKFYSPADLGVYNRARGYAAMPSQQVTGVIQNVTFPVLSKMQNDNESLARNYRRMLRSTAFIVFPLMLMLAALARPLVITLITAKWEACIILLQIICFSMMWYPIHSINLNLLMVKGRSDLFLRLEIIKKIIGLSILTITLPQGLIIFCCGNILSSIISLIINTYYTGKLIHIGLFKQMRDLMPIIILSLVMFGVILLANHFITNLYIQIIIGGIIGVTVYLGGAILFKFKELNDVKYMLKRKA
ncbi:MAG: lipopolysaccharide biosynthesis protein [Phocaeicola plebeius]|uniref:lipopolysaccharide biosynthesis protein n=1 Tax=Phocaeicola plebeius TaxID=310297 RepID=UPI00241EFC35|nr:lipopolysaccharide biosynthesis protein [Phocaeicola plebeius]MBS5539357.1 lipopolysaccharide biosynthesis protein [Phocaeicola plebeius]